MKERGMNNESKEKEEKDPERNNKQREQRHPLSTII
jgi:hypothetical protein